MRMRITTDVSDRHHITSESHCHWHITCKIDWKIHALHKKSHLPLAPQVTEVQSTPPTPVMNYSQSRNGLGREGRSRPYPYQYQPVSCWTCNLPGHISRNCLQKGLVAPETPASTGVANRGFGRKKDLTLDESNVYIPLVLAGKEISCMLDTGF